MKEGDILEVVHNSGQDGLFPEIKKGQKFIANSFHECCGIIGVDIGLRLLRHAFNQRCAKCGKSNNINGTAFYIKDYFRVIEPEYRTVEISSEIKKQELQLN